MRGWQANKKAHLWAANRKGLCPKLKNHPLGGWLFIMVIDLHVSYFTVYAKNQARTRY